MAPTIDQRSLPAGWEMPTIGDICQKIKKVNPKENPELEFDYIDISGIDNTNYRISATKWYVGEKAPSRARQLVKSGDIVFSTVRTYLKNMARVPLDLDGQIASTGFCVLRTAAPELSKYLFYYLQYEPFLSELAKFQRGTSYPAVRDGDVFAQYITLPPRRQAEQIVAEIEKQFSRLDEAVANLKRVKANLKRYKAAVLKAAVEGKLTEEWRKTHIRAESDGVGAGLKPAPTEPIETGAELLERILEERRANWQGRGKYKEPVAPDTSGLPELPEGWVWATYEQLGKLQLGRQRAPKYHSGLHMRPYLRVQNVFEDRIDISDVKEMDFSPADFERYQLLPGDLLLNEGQSPELLGRPAIYRGELPGACFTNTLIRFRSREGVIVQFALIVSRHNMHSGRFVEEGTITTNIAHLSVGRLAAVEFPLPPKSEQERIVAEVERHLSIAKEAEAQADANLRRADRLRQSILKQAFSGQLVPQDPNDEPASVLLERIRTNVDVGATHASPNPTAQRQKRARHASPLRDVATTNPESSDYKSLDSVLTAILNHMVPGREYSRAEIADPLGLSPSRWNAAIQELKRRGKVRQEGDRRAARYQRIF